MRRVRPIGENESVNEEEFEEVRIGNSPSLIIECLLFCCHVYSSLGLSNESSKILQLLEVDAEKNLLTRVRVWNEVMLNERRDE